MPARKQYTFRRWTVTYHLPDDLASDLSEYQVAIKEAKGDDLDRINKAVFEILAPLWNFDSGKFTSWVFQVEECPGTARLHIQGYCSFKDAITRTAVSKILFMSGVHLEPAHSDAQTNFKYCTKKDSRVFGPWAFGDFGGPGHRSDLDALYAMAEQHATGREMLQQLGAKGMRHLYLYQKTTRVLLEDDDADARIMAARDARRQTVAEGAARARVRHVSDEEQTESDESDDDDQPFGDFTQ